MPDFSIHDVKVVCEIYSEEKVNNLLRNGWVLLSVGFNTEDNVTNKVYILGATDAEKEAPVTPRLNKLREE